MTESESPRDPFLGEIQTEIIGMQYHEAKIPPGEQVNLERESKSARHRRAIRVENGRFEPVGYLPRKTSSWLAPLIDSGQIHLDGYVPHGSPDAGGDEDRSPLTLMVFQREGGHRLLGKAEPHTDLEALHQTVLRAFLDAQGFHTPELILGLAKRLQPLEKQELLPETRLLLALLPSMAHELQMSQGLQATARFRELLRTVILFNIDSKADSKAGREANSCLVRCRDEALAPSATPSCTACTTRRATAVRFGCCEN